MSLEDLKILDWIPEIQAQKDGVFLRKELICFMLVHWTQSEPWFPEQSCEG